jgi:hypothetical protein
MRYIIYRALLPFTQLREVSYRSRMQGGLRCWKIPHSCCCHPPTMPNDPSPSGYCLHFNSRGNCSRTCEDTSYQAQAFPQTSQNTDRSNTAILEAIKAPLPSTNNQQCQTIPHIRLLPPLQFSRKLLENLQRHIQSSVSLPSHLPKYTSMKHCHFGRLGRRCLRYHTLKW